MKSRAKVHAYWRKPSGKNAPEQYLTVGKDRRSQALLKLFQEIGVSERDAILEIGCNAGRNLRHLWDAGFRHLYGIEINQDAVDLMTKGNPSLQVDIVVGPVEEVLAKVPAVDVVFTLAVLMHIHPDSEFIFAEMAEKSRKYVVTIEKETTSGAFHFPRSYQDIFESLGMRQVHHSNSLGGLNPDYHTRVFAHERGSL